MPPAAPTGRPPATAGTQSEWAAGGSGPPPPPHPPPGAARRLPRRQTAPAGPLRRGRQAARRWGRAHSRVDAYCQLPGKLLETDAEVQCYARVRKRPAGSAWHAGPAPRTLRGLQAPQLALQLAHALVRLCGCAAGCLVVRLQGMARGRGQDGERQRGRGSRCPADVPPEGLAWVFTQFALELARASAPHQGAPAAAPAPTCACCTAASRSATYCRASEAATPARSIASRAAATRWRWLAMASWVLQGRRCWAGWHGGAMLSQARKGWGWGWG